MTEETRFLAYPCQVIVPTLLVIACPIALRAVVWDFSHWVAAGDGWAMGRCTLKQIENARAIEKKFPVI